MVDIAEQLSPLLVDLYGKDIAEATLPRILSVMAKYKTSNTKQRAINHTDIMLIAHSDVIQSNNPSTRPFSVLVEWLINHRIEVSMLHAIHLRPSSSDEGFSVMDYKSYDERLVNSDDISVLHNSGISLMADLVLNHCSQHHPWFKQFLNDEKTGCDYFISPTCDSDIDGVFRARKHPLVSDFGKNVWTTYSRDQVDLNFKNPDVLIEFVDILLGYASDVAMKAVRLDAFSYVWKECGTCCVALPQTHSLLKILKIVVDKRVELIVSVTNVTQAVNLTYSPDAFVYNFPLPGLLLHAMHYNNTLSLVKYCMSNSLNSRCVNFCAGHDGIGLGWLEGLVDRDSIVELSRRVSGTGGIVWRRYRFTGDPDPSYELNVSLWSALHDDKYHAQRFIAVHSVVLCLKGLPALYFQSLLATPNNTDTVVDEGGVQQDHRRSINRSKFRVDLVTDGPVLEDINHMCRIRRGCIAFDPESSQIIPEVEDDRVFIVDRCNGSVRMICVTNFSADSIVLDVTNIVGRTLNATLLDTINDRVVNGVLELKPYDVQWIQVDAEYRGPPALSTYQKYIIPLNIVVNSAFHFGHHVPTVNDLRQALCRLVMKHPCMSLRVTCSGLAPSAIMIPIVTSDRNWRDVMIEPVESFKRELCGCCIVICGQTVVFKIDHSLCDGRSTQQLAIDLIKALNGADIGEREYMVEWEKRLPDIECDDFQLEQCDRIRSDLELGIPIHHSQHNMLFESLKIDVGDILGAIKRHGVGFWAAIQAAVHFAECVVMDQQRTTPPYSMGARVVVDIRSFLSPTLPQSYMDPIVSHYSQKSKILNRSTNFWDLARSLQDSDTGLNRAVYYAKQKYQSTNFRDALSHASTSVNNAGYLPVLEEGEYRIEGVDYFCTRASVSDTKQHHIRVITHTMGSMLTLSIWYSPHAFTQTTILGFLVEIQGILDKVSGGSPVLGSFLKSDC